MTKTKSGATIGRPKGSGAGLEARLTVRLLPEVRAVLEREAAAAHLEPTVLARDVLTRWAKRRGGAS
jgi:hypothetical protein